MSCRSDNYDGLSRLRFKSAGVSGIAFPVESGKSKNMLAAVSAIVPKIASTIFLSMTL